MARTYRALAALLSYPTPDLQEAAEEIATVLIQESLVSPARRLAIIDFLDDLATANIYDLQERYVDLFDRGRSVSLHLFEHVHGESRDRGQAMADLKALYAEHGLEMQQGELPDFLPLFLEFLSLLPETEAQALLAEPAAILRALADRLGARDKGYAAVLEALAALAQAPAIGASAIPDEDPTDLAALDAAWEEAAVRFGPGEAMDGCSTDRLRTRLRAAQRDAGSAPPPSSGTPAHSPTLRSVPHDAAPAASMADATSHERSSDATLHVPSRDAVPRPPSYGSTGRAPSRDTASHAPSRDAA